MEKEVVLPTQRLIRQSEQRVKLLDEFTIAHQLRDFNGRTRLGGRSSKSLMVEGESVALVLVHCGTDRQHPHGERLSH